MFSQRPALNDNIPSINDMPVLLHLKAIFQEEFGQDFAMLPNRNNTLFIFVQHGYPSVLTMMDFLLELGIKQEYLFMTTKPHTTSNQMIKEFEKRFHDHYVRFKWPTVKELSKNYETITKETHEALLHKVCDFLLHYPQGYQHEIKNIIICDEGGKFLKLFTEFYKSESSKNIYARNISDFHIVAIEHTMCGTKDDCLHDLPFFLISMAGSCVKKKFESPIIAQSMLKNLKIILDNIFQKQFHSIIGIIGAGNIGQNVIQFLRKQFPQTRLLIYDEKSAILNKLNDSDFSEKISCVDKKTLFQQANIILGCTGTDITNPKGFSPEWLKSNSFDQIHFISCSSGIREYKTLLYASPNYTFNSLDDMRDLTFLLQGTNKCYTLYNGGFPINFLVGRDENIDLYEIQLTRGMKSAAIIQALKLLKIINFLKENISAKFHLPMSNIIQLDRHYQLQIIQSYIKTMPKIENSESSSFKEPTLYDIAQESDGIQQPSDRDILSYHPQWPFHTKSDCFPDYIPEPLYAIYNAYNNNSALLENMLSNYVMLNCSDYHAEITSELLKELEAFEENTTTDIFLLHGEAGSGKSSAARLFQRRLWIKWKETDGRNNLYVPLLIELKQVKPRFREKDFLTECLQQSPYHYSIEQIILLKRHYQFCFIFDGLDECPEAAKRYFIIDIQLPTWRAKVLLTARTEWLKKEWFMKEKTQRFSAIEKNTLTDKQYKVTIKYISCFSLEQIDEYLRLRFQGTLFQVYKNFLYKQKELLKLAASPVMLNIICSILPNLSEYKASKATIFTRVELYSIFLDKWFEREIDKNKIEFDLAEYTDEELKVAFFDYTKNLAYTMFQEKTLVVDKLYCIANPLEHLASFSSNHNVAKTSRPDPWARFFDGSHPLIVQAQRACPLSIERYDQNRDRYHRYQFSHKTFMEYAAAAFLWDKLIKDDLALILNTWNVRFLTEEEGVSLFLKEFLNNSIMRIEDEKKLLKLIYASRNNPANAKAASNAITLLNMCRFNFSDIALQDLSCINIPNADLTEGLLAYVNLSDSDLSNVNFHNAVLVGSKFCRSNIHEARFLEGDQFVLCNNEIQAIASHPIDYDIIAYNDKSEVIITRFSSGMIEKRLSGHISKVKCIAWAPDGMFIASGSWDFTICIWDIHKSENNALIKTLKMHTQGVFSLAWSPNGEFLVSGGFDCTICLWSAGKPEYTLETIKIEERLPGLQCQKLDKYDNLYKAIGIYINQNEEFIINLITTNLKNNRGKYEPLIVDLFSHNQTFEDYVDGIRLKKTSSNLPHALLMQLLNRAILIVHHDGTIDNKDSPWIYFDEPVFVFCDKQGHYHAYIRDSQEKGRKLLEVATITIEALKKSLERFKFIRKLTAHDNCVENLIWSTDGKLASNDHKTICFWDFHKDENYALTRLFEKRKINCIAWLYDKNFAYALYDTIYIINTEILDKPIIDSKKLEKLTLMLTLKSDNTVHCMTCSIDGILAAGSDKFIISWDLQNIDNRKIFKGHTGEVYSITWSCEQKIISGAKDRTIRTWDLEKKVATNQTDLNLRREHTENVTCLAWSSNGILASGDEEGCVRLWRITQKQNNFHIKTLRNTKSGNKVTNIAWSKENQLAIIWGKIIQVWDLTTPIEPVYIRQLRDHACSQITCLTWSVTNQLISTSSRDFSQDKIDGFIRFWQQETDIEPATYTQNFQIESMSCSLNDKFAFCSSTGLVNISSIKIYDSLKGFNISTNLVTCLAWSPNETLACGRQDKTVYIWVSEDSSFNKILNGHTNSITSLTWSQNGEWLATASVNEILVWNSLDFEKNPIHLPFGSNHIAFFHDNLSLTHLNCVHVINLQHLQQAPKINWTVATSRRLWLQGCNITDTKNVSGSTQNLFKMKGALGTETVTPPLLAEKKPHTLFASIANNFKNQRNHEQISAQYNYPG